MGVFVETPSAVSELPYLLVHDVKMVFIGTKDLTQTILACDRGNSTVQHLYDPKKRPVVSAIECALQACESRGVPACLFASTVDVPFFLERFPRLHRISLCCSEYLDLLRKGPASAFRTARR